MNKYIINIMILLAALSVMLIGCPASSDDSDSSHKSNTTVKPADSSSAADNDSSQSQPDNDSSEPSEDDSSAEEPVTTATLAVTIICSDVTMDDIYQIVFGWGEGEYSADNTTQVGTKRIAKDDMKITKDKESAKAGTVSFVIVEDQLSESGFTLFYELRIADKSNKTLGNLKEIYQDDVVFTQTTKHSITLTVDGIYADQGFDLN